MAAPVREGLTATVRTDRRRGASPQLPRHAARGVQCRRSRMNLILLLVLLVLLVGALPTWPYSQGWGYYPSGGLGLLLLIVIIMALMRTPA
jgi:membrane protein YdbS with pleckstrin-like domain